VGLTEFEGQTPTVFKGFYAPTEDFIKALSQLNLPKNKNPRPTPSQVAKYVPRLDEGLDDDAGHTPISALDDGFGRDGRDIADRDQLRGAA